MKSNQSCGHKREMIELRKAKKTTAKNQNNQKWKNDNAHQKCEKKTFRSNEIITWKILSTLTHFNCNILIFIIIFILFPRFFIAGLFHWLSPLFLKLFRLWNDIRRFNFLVVVTASVMHFFFFSVVFHFFLFFISNWWLWSNVWLFCLVVVNTLQLYEKERKLKRCWDLLKHTVKMKEKRYFFNVRCK